MAIIQSLQVFRGFAALAVVGHHAVVSTGAFVSVVPTPVEAFLGRGFLGVDFFFVLSGFIIMYAHMDDRPSGLAVRRYAFKRIVRIFPPYLPLSITMIALYAAIPGFSASGGRDFSWVSSLLLLPADQPPALSVAWTLVHEMQFYAVFLLFFLSRRLLVVGLLLWGGAIIISHLAFVPTGWARYPLSLLNLEFMFGVLAAWMVKGTGSRLAPGWWVGAGVVLALMMLALMTEDTLPLARLAFAFGLALVVIGFALFERGATLAWPALLLLMGNASYSIYLIHNPLLSITQRLFGRLDAGWLAALLLGVTASLLAGVLYYWLVERPALGFFRKRRAMTTCPLQVN